jgi:hypothetical protein
VIVQCWYSDSTVMLYSLMVHPAPTTARPTMVHWWCSDGAVMVQWWCSDGAVMVQWWCSDDNLKIGPMLLHRTGWCTHCIITVSSLHPPVSTPPCTVKQHWTNLQVIITAPSLHHHCTITAPSLYHHCTITAPSLHHRWPSSCGRWMNHQWI